MLQTPESRSQSPGHASVCIDDLPHEILSEIILLAVNPDGQYLALQNGRERLKQNARRLISRLLVVTSVCRYWREVSLGCQELWGVICIRKRTNFAELMLERSGNAAVAIWYDDTEPHNHLDTQLELLEKIILRPERLHSAQFMFDMIPYGRSFFNPLGNLFSKWHDAPVLEELGLRLCDEDFRGTAGLPNGFLVGGAPSLKKWNSIGFNIFTSNAPLQSLGANLTHLFLSPYLESDSLFVRPLNCCPNACLEFLAQQAPSLESIKLDFTIPLQLARPDEPTLIPLNNHHLPITIFPCLKRLQVADFHQELVAFCRSIQIPNAEYSYLRFGRSHRLQNRSMMEVLDDLFATMPSTFLPADTPGFTSLFLIGGLESEWIERGMEYTIKVRLEFDSYDFTLPGCMAVLARHMSTFQSLICLCLSGDWTKYVARSLWGDAFGHLPCLADVVFDASVSMTFVKALGDKDETGSSFSGSQRPRPLFPALSVLEYDYLDRKDASGDGLVSLLIEAWRDGARAELCPRLRLVVPGGYLEEGDIVRLRDAVPTIKVRRSKDTEE